MTKKQSKKGIYEIAEDYIDVSKDPEAGIEYLKSLSLRRDLDWLLNQIEPAALDVLTRSGATIDALPDGRRVVRGLPRPPDVEAVCAGSVLNWIDEVKGAIDRNDAKFAATAGLQLGTYFEMLGVLPFELFVEPGRAVVEGGHKGAELQYGTVEDREERKAEYRAAYEAVRREHPNSSERTVCEEAGKRTGVSGRTIRRYLTK